MGRVTAVIGGNGAGRSTLFKLLGCLYEPAGGRILFGSDDIPDLDLPQWQTGLRMFFSAIRA